MEKIVDFIRGKRTYIVSTTLVLTAVLSYVDGQTGMFEMVENILIALGLSSLRAGVSNTIR